MSETAARIAVAEMTLEDPPSGLMWMSAGAVSFLVVSSLLVICAEFKRKQNKTLKAEPVQLLYRRKNTDYGESGGRPSAAVKQTTLQLPSSVEARSTSPTWRNSSLSRELPAIPDSLELGEGVRDERYESASNLYAYLDDVRTREEHENAQASDSSRDAELPVVLPNGRVHPYDRIGGHGPLSPTLHANMALTPPPVSTAPLLSTSTNNHAFILNQMDNEQEYRGARSDMSYTSITVRAPLSNLRARRFSEDGYTKLSGEESHLYAQVGGDYGGSMVSDPSSVHIYNELYAEIDGRSQINPYATSRLAVVHPAEAGDGPSTSGMASGSSRSPPTPEELDKLYAKINKRNRAPDTQPSFVETPSNQVPRPSEVSSLNDMRASVDEAISTMDTSLSRFLANGTSSRAIDQTNTHTVDRNMNLERSPVVTTRNLSRREHVYEEM
ncbi:hypothetical protein RvY_15529 [Ramazzottius varieornatus]|uniref:Uncharacterized protein n=1 Tax=Ramazzottius varieornatus TaxID=947166 RepID=A0A1D1VV86_RAMVA|nr:hypothetical protein RvY_15529 [Ramazzottius varieornatus]